MLRASENTRSQLVFFSINFINEKTATTNQKLNSIAPVPCLPINKNQSALKNSAELIKAITLPNHFFRTIYRSKTVAPAIITLGKRMLMVLGSKNCRLSHCSSECSGYKGWLMMELSELLWAAVSSSTSLRPLGKEPRRHNKK